MKNFRIGLSFCFALLFFAGCSMRNDQGESYIPFFVNRGDEFQTLLTASQNDISTTLVANTESLTPPNFFSFNATADTSVEVKSTPDAPANTWSMKLSAQGKTKSYSNGLLDGQQQGETSLQIVGKIPTPVGEIKSIDLGTDIRIDKDALFFLFKTLNITMADDKAFPADFSSIVGNFYETKITEVLQQMGQTPETIEKITKGNVFKTPSLAAVSEALGKNTLFSFQGFKEEKGAQRVYAVTLNNEGVKNIYRALIPSPDEKTTEEALKTIDGLSFDGTVTLSHTDSKFLEVEGLLARKGETEKKKMHLLRSAEKFQFSLSSGDGTKEEFSLENTDAEFVMRSGEGTTLTAEKKPGQLTGNISNATTTPAVTIATFSFSTENGKTNGTIAFPDKKISILLANGSFDAQKGITGEISVTSPLVSGKGNVNVVITPQESITIDHPEGAHPLQEFKNAALAIGISVMGAMQNKNGEPGTSPAPQKSSSEGEKQ
ncbi:MAG: hypothetical protein WCJ84_02245 [Candidatus Peregrinibacteria bacterium]